MYDELFYIPDYTKYTRKIAEKQQFSVVLMCQSLKNYKLSFPPPLYLYLLLSLVVASNLNKVIFWTASIFWLILWMRMLGVKCLCLV